MLLMQNNLSEMIRLAGMTKREVAALKGITPENLSRQANGHTNINLRDAEEYADILNCLPEEVMFASRPIKLLAKWILNKDQQPVTSFNAALNEAVYLHQYYAKNTACIMSDFGLGVPWEYESWDGQLEVIDYEPALNGVVSRDCFERPCYALTHDNKLLWGILYPQPGKLYSLYGNAAPGFNDKKDLKLKWACPVLSIIRRPDLLGVRYVNEANLKT